MLHDLIADAAAIVAYGSLCFPRNRAIVVGKERGAWVAQVNTAFCCTLHVYTSLCSFFTHINLAALFFPRFTLFLFSFFTPAFVMKYQFLLSIFAITLSQAAVIPQHGNHANEQSLTSLDSEAAALLSEDVFGMNNQQNDNDDDPLIDDIEVNDELQHEDGDEHQDIIEDTTYTLDEYGRFVPVATATQDTIDIDENNQQDDIDVDHNDPGMHMIVDSTMATSNEPVVHGGEEDGDEIGDEVYVFEDDEDTLDQKLEIDPETGMPFFKNKYETDFDHHIQWAAQANSNEMYDEDDSQQLAQHQYHPAALPFCPMDWRVILLGLIVVAIIVRVVWRKVYIKSFMPIMKS